MSKTEERAKGRYSLIDAIRGIAIINMVAFHLCYDIFCVFGVWSAFPVNTAVVIWERAICSTFIIVSGVSLNFSVHGYRRGLLVSVAGALVTAVTVIFMPSEAIYFGVLTFLGCAMLITFALRKPLSRINPVVGAVVAFVLFMLLYGLPQGFIGIFDLPLVRLPAELYRYPVLAFLGFPAKGFASADYFPLLQWLFLYIFGFELWRIVERTGLDRCFYKRIPVLDFIGRHSLFIYLIHQPVLYGLCYVIFSLIIR